MLNTIAREACACPRCIGATPYNAGAECSFDIIYDAALMAYRAALGAAVNAWRGCGNYDNVPRAILAIGERIGNEVDDGE